MANIQSQIKRNRQNEKRRLRNRDVRGSARSAVKSAFTSMGSGQDSQASVAAAIVALDRAARKGVIHPRNAARRKSRLLKRLHAMGGASMAQPSQPALMPEAAPKAGKRAVAEPKPKAEPKKAATKAAAKKAPAKKTTTK
ncbi:MAG TPA: 30S ribosomal protein S20 [Anaerolineales bacterium]